VRLHLVDRRALECNIAVTLGDRVVQPLGAVAGDPLGAAAARARVACLVEDEAVAVALAVRA
jgi:hypothetical protein